MNNSIFQAFKASEIWATFTVTEDIIIILAVTNFFRMDNLEDYNSNFGKFYFGKYLEDHKKKKEISSTVY